MKDVAAQLGAARRGLVFHVFVDQNIQKSLIKRAFGNVKKFNFLEIILSLPEETSFASSGQR